MVYFVYGMEGVEIPIEQPDECIFVYVDAFFLAIADEADGGISK